jgi:hypothetical protein
MKLAFTLCLVLFSCFSFSQSLTQTVRGKVVDRETQFPLPGATIILLSDTVRLKGSSTDESGNFRIENVSVGRHRFKISFIGYTDRILDNIMVSSAKEVILSITMDELFTQLAEVSVTAGRDGTVSNEMAAVSARSFTIEETQRYAGSRGDPARMASNFAGVQGADDSRNDIVVRGNSPQSLLWRLEGINIPNPNHFNIPGTAGGPVSMINNKTLANSDFFTGAFPAEYGNSISGVFDLKLRNGNNEKHELSAQFGFLGTEIFAEGPLSRKRRSSYLFSYRYSTLSLFNKLGIDIGTTAIPRYQDLSFKFNFPLKNKSSLSFFGIGGNSHIDILISEQKKPERNLYGENDRDQYFKTGAGVVGMSYKNPLSASTYFTATAAVSGEMVDAYDDLVYRHLNNERYVVDSLKPILDYNFRQNKISASFLLSRKMTNRGVINTGFSNDVYFFNFRDSVRNIVEGSAGYLTWRTRWNSQVSATLFQPFVQWKYNVSNSVDVIAGVHAQYFSLSNSLSPVEPRVGLKWTINQRTTFNAGAGLHSQIQSTYLYFYGISNDASGNPQPHNRKMDFSKSIHAVVSLQRSLGSDVRLKTEAYFQHLYHVPVEMRSSSFSLLNSGAGFSRFFPDTLSNTGIGRNYGIEMTLEKSLSKGYLCLVTGSLFESKYRGSDNIWRDTDFNGNYVFNVLVTKEWFFRKKNTFSLGWKMTTAGGRRYGDVDEAASEKERDVIWIDKTRNSHQFRSYFRTDIRISYTINRPKVTHEVAIDLVNILGTKNILKLTYAPNDANPSASKVRQEYQLGFLPLFYYKLDF